MRTKILFLGAYYVPEEQNALVHELTSGLVAKGHDVTVVTAFPNYGKGRIYDGYENQIFARERIDGVNVIRAWIYATPSKAFLPRILNFGSFCASSFLPALLAAQRPDVVYTWIPPLPLGVTAGIVAAARGAKLVVHVQDIYPRAAVEHGVLKNPSAIRFFERMERGVYRRADKVVVISEGFKDDLVEKGVPEGKVEIIENWADASMIVPGPKDNEFRRELGAAGKRFVVTYSGGLNNNAYLDGLIGASRLLRDEPVQVVIVGEGQYKERLESLVQSGGGSNVVFLPFQPLGRYPDVLRAADLTVVPLHTKSAITSVPSKIYKQMAAGRPILALTPSGNELSRLVTAARCGICVAPEDARGIAGAIRWALAHPEELIVMGRNARQYLAEHHDRQRSVDRVSDVVTELVHPPVSAPPGPSRRKRVHAARSPRA